VRVSLKKHIHYRDRKCTTTQNVTCVVDLDLCFTYVYAGWEGSTHDAHIFTICVNELELKFLTPVGGIVPLIFTKNRLQNLLSWSKISKHIN
jgi:hypothetical protein